MLEKKVKVGGLIFPDFKTYYKAIVMKNTLVLALRQIYRPQTE